MWKEINKWNVGDSLHNEKEKVSAMCFKEQLYVGNEDGIIRVYSNDLLYSFKAFELRFDYLESCDVSERVTAIERLNTGGVYHNLIVSNERNIKIIEVRNSESTKNISQGILSNTYSTTMVKEFNNVHSYMINSVSLSKDNQFFLSSDYLVVNLWNPERLEMGYNLLDIRPRDGDELVYVINAAKFSQHDCNIFGYSTTSGDLVLNDIRLSSKSETIKTINSKNSTVSDGSLKSISDFCFVNETNVCIRTLNSVSMFDCRNLESEVFRVDFCDNFYQGSDVFKTDVVYEKFKITNNEKNIFTRSFDDTLCAIDIKNGEKEEILIENVGEDNEITSKPKLISCKNNTVYCVEGDYVCEYAYEN